jgi:hypothetical protein
MPHINTMWTVDIGTPGDCLGVACISYSHNVFLPLCFWAHMSGLNILICAPLCYKREGTRRYKTDIESSRAHKTLIQTHKLSSSLIRSSSQTQYT